MLKVRTRLEQSTIPGAGMGLFADEFIKEGTVIWKLDINIDRLISKDDFENMDPIYKTFVSTYGYTRRDYPFIILCADNARFVNHFTSGNMVGNDEPFGSMEVSIANRDIQIGEEILEDYTIFDDKSIDDKNSDYY